ncbi:relaxase/mobilization nuclease domain-containing protein [Streptosporangium sp. OZ121]|uniref:relaxase/mobilization nuclease domain-containing protein n=1 Tax=Streptosporangium sp. OZ121 TaxID=3444183 RepID=UPI003F7A97ED
MINKIAAQHGRDVGGLLRYLFGPGRANEHRDQRVIAADHVLEVVDGARLDAPQHWDQVLELGHALDDHRVIAGIAPEQGWVWHCAISLPAGEVLADEQWAVVARAAVERLGFDDSTGKAPCRWIAVHHGPSAGGNDHIHLAVNLVREDGTLAAPGRDRRVMSALCADMERRFGLYVVEGRPGRGLPGYSRAEAERAQRLQRAQPARVRGAGTGPPSRSPAAEPGPGGGDPDRQRLARLIRSAAASSASEAEFVRQAKDCGVWVRPRFATGGQERVVGYSAALRPVDGRTAVWFGGGKLAADLTLPRLREHWDVDGGEHQALAEWRRSPAAAASPPGPGEQAAVDVAQWKRAAQLVDAVHERLRHTPPGDVVAWRIGCRGAAAMLAALAERVEGRGGGPGPIAALADRLAWSAQAPRSEARSRTPVGGEVRAVARIIRQAVREGPATATWMVVAAALVVLVATIAAWHTQHRQLRQAASLTTHAEALARDLHRRRAEHAPAWTQRRYGAISDARLAQLAVVAADDLARLSNPPPAAPPPPARPVDQEAHGAAAAALAFPGRRRPATVAEARRQLAAITEEIGLRAAMPAERVAQERTERAQAAQAQQAQRAQAQRTTRPTPRRGPSPGRGGRGR